MRVYAGTFEGISIRIDFRTALPGITAPCPNLLSVHAEIFALVVLMESGESQELTFKETINVRSSSIIMTIAVCATDILVRW